MLDGADKAFARLGVSAAGMAEIAEAAGCSRATLYRVFPNRHALHLAYVRHQAAEIQAEAARCARRVRDPKRRLAAHLLAAVRLVRERPGTAAWFAPTALGLGVRMARAPEVVDALARSFGAGAIESAGADARDRLEVRFLVRVIVSLLSDPAPSATEERALVERFVVPAVLGDRSD